MGKKEMAFKRENVFISSLIIYTNKWKNGKKEMNFKRENAFIGIYIMYSKKKEKWARKKTIF